MASSPEASRQRGAIQAPRRSRAAPDSRPIPGLFVNRGFVADPALPPIVTTGRSEFGR